MGAILAAFMMAFSALGLTQTATQGVSLYTAYPSQVVRSGDTVDVSVQVGNTGLPTQLVQLAVSGTPDGWSANFLGGGRVIQAVSVQTDQTQTITLKVELPEQAADGDYSMTVTAKSEGGQASLPSDLYRGPDIAHPHQPNSQLAGPQRLSEIVFQLSADGQE